MDEYINDLKGQSICVRELHDQCGCYQCRKEKNEEAEDSSPSETLSLNECSVRDEPNRA